MYMDQKESTLASEILGELKASCRRWFIAFCIMVALEIATIAGFMWYISLPIDESEIQVENADGSANYVGRDWSGGIFNGEHQSDTETESNAE